MKYLTALIITITFILSVQAQIVDVDIPDAEYMQFLINNGIDINNRIDINSDGEVQNWEAETITELNVVVEGPFNSIDGIKSFVNLKILRVDGSEVMINVDGMPALRS